MVPNYGLGGSGYQTVDKWAAVLNNINKAT